MPTPLSEHEQKIEKCRFYLALCDDIPVRMPPRCDPSPYILKMANDFQPPACAEQRDSAMSAGFVASYIYLVPVWRDAYLHQDERRAALAHLMARHAVKRPKIHRGVISLPSDLHRWAYLLWSFQEFGESGAAAVTGLSCGRIRKLYREAWSTIQDAL